MCGILSLATQKKITNQILISPKNPLRANQMETTTTSTAPMSNSIILNRILETESCELKQTIDAFMASKLAEFQQVMKEKVDQVVSQKLCDFFTPNEQPHLEDMVFDKPANEHLIQLVQQNTLGRSSQNERFTDMLNEARTQKHFVCYNTHFTWYVYKDIYIQAYGHGIYQVEKHGLPLHLLLVFKTMQGGLTELIKLYKEYPQYLTPISHTFERVCQAEHAEIQHRVELVQTSQEETNEMITEACRLIDTYKSKMAHYASLDQRVEELERREKKVQEETQSLEKFKRRLLEREAEIAKEREELDKPKKRSKKQKQIIIL